MIRASLLAALVFTGSGFQWTKDPQVAQGEWKIQVQTPPCDSVHNLEVIYPKESGAPITIECNAMTVGEK